MVVEPDNRNLQEPEEKVYEKKMEEEEEELPYREQGEMVEEREVVEEGEVVGEEVEEGEVVEEGTSWKRWCYGGPIG